MSKETFHIIYDGEAFKEHEMNAKSLSSALLSIAEIFEEADKLLNHGCTKSEVNIKASFKTGSFQIDFTTAQSFVQTVQGFLVSDITNAMVNATTLVNLVGGGCIALYKWLKGKLPTKIEPINDSKNIRIYRTDKEYQEVEKRVLELYNSIKIKENLKEAITEPLKKDGCDGFAIISGNQVIQHVNKEESKYFDSSNLLEAQEQLISTNQYEYTYTLVSVIFKKDNKWRLSDGSTEIKATSGI